VPAGCYFAISPAAKPPCPINRPASSVDRPFTGTLGASEPRVEQGYQQIIGVEYTKPPLVAPGHVPQAAPSLEYPNCCRP